MGISPGSILYDASGNSVAIAPGSSVAATQPASMIVGSDYGSSPTARAPKVDSAGNLFVQNSDVGPSAATAANNLRTLLLNGTASSMIVNGSSTNAVYSWVPPTATSSYVVTAVNFVISAASVIMQGKYWLALSGGLTNGVLVQASAGGTYSTLANLKINEDFLAYSYNPTISLIGSTDYIQARINLLQPIGVGSGDGVRVTIRDNLATNNAGGLLTSGTANVYYMVAYVEGIRLTA